MHTRKHKAVSSLCEFYIYIHDVYLYTYIFQSVRAVEAINTCANALPERRLYGYHDALDAGCDVVALVYILWLYFCAPRVVPLPSSPLRARKTWPFIWLGNVNEYQCAVKKPSTTFSICECDILTLIAQHTRARAAELCCCYWRRRRWTAAAGAAAADTAHKTIFLYVLVLGGDARCRTSAKHGLMLHASSIEGTFCVCVHCA